LLDVHIGKEQPGLVAYNNSHDEVADTNEGSIFWSLLPTHWQRSQRTGSAYSALKTPCKRRWTP
jgi:hypothetical protein